MARQKVDGSNIFSIENSSYLHTQLPVDKFTARDISEADLPFYYDLLSNQQVVVKLFGDGKPKTPDEVNGKFQDWNKRFASTQPHGALTVLDAVGEAIGFILCREGEGKGVSEVSYALTPSAQGQGIGSAVLKSVVETWAEEVNGIGVGKIADDHFPQLQEAFRCFGGDALRRFDATYSPLNIASGRILGKAGFVMAQSGLCNDNTFDLTNTDLSLARVEDAEIIAAKFLEGREKNKRYTCIDQDGVEHTLSYKENFKSFRFHVEKEIGR
jgi:RimJ/RimL family protein N-acetyltransferase